MVGKYRVYWNFLSLLLTFWMLNLSSEQNLFCNADFENYNLPTTTSSYPVLKYEFVYSDPCWYPIGADNFFEVKELVQFNYSKSIEFAANTSVERICQNVTLQTGEYYNLSVDIGFQETMLATTLYIYLNSDLKLSYPQNTVFPAFAHVTYIFKSNTSATAVCFYVNDLWSGTPSSRLSTMADNFSLRKLARINILINYDVTYNEATSLMILNSSTVLAPKLLQKLKVNSRIYVDSILLPSSLFYLDNFGCASVRVLAYNITDLNTIQYAVDPQLFYEGGVYNFTISFTNIQVQPKTTTQQQNKTVIVKGEDTALNDLHNFGHEVVLKIWIIYQYGRLFTSSFYFFNFLSFFNIVSMYNFLNIPTQASFSYQTISDLINSSLSANSTFQMAYNLFASTEMPAQWLQNALEDGNQQRIAATKGSFYWFSSYGITDQFLENNSEFLFTLALLLAKFAAFFALSAASWCLFAKSLFTLPAMLEVLLVEVICNSFTIFLSGFSTLQRLAGLSLLAKLNSLLHVAAVFACIAAATIYFMPARQLFKLKKKRKKYTFFSYEGYMIGRQILYVALSSIICFSDWAFLIVMSIYIIASLLHMYFSFRCWKLMRKVEGATFITILAAHHLFFITMFVFSKIGSLDEDSQKICTCLSIIVIITILLAALFEITFVAIEIYNQIVKPSLVIVLKLIRRFFGCQQAPKPIKLAKKPKSTVKLILVEKLESTQIVISQTPKQKHIFKRFRNNNLSQK